MITIIINIVNPAMNRDKDSFQEITIISDMLKNAERTYTIHVGKIEQTVTQETMNKIASVFQSLKQNT